ncbi:N-alpha-acetyltransferase 35 NatC auxiliary subunit [Nymphaea thermarum]|nr:N-alpha-acetyltransferase 35 NatC auxiliary subunit [Nymphaea thermarum]
MDPKMDSGMETCGYRSIEEAIDCGAAPIPFCSDRTVDIQCMIDVMDHLLACEEEDLFIMAFGLPLKEEGDEKCLSMLSAVEETVCRQLRACKALLSKKKTIEDVEPLQANPDLEEGYCRAVLCRLRFRKHLHHVLTCLRKPQGRGLELARKHIASCLLELAAMRESSGFLVCNTYVTSQVNVEDRTTASGCPPVGFEANLNARLSAPTPPRAIKILSWTKTLEYFEKLLQDLDVIGAVSLDLHVEELLEFIVKFQKSQPDLVARAHLQVLLIHDGKLYGRDPFHEVISQATALPHIMKNTELQKHELIQRLGQLLISLLKILCTNTAWQRRKLGKILQDWSIIAGQLDLSSSKESGDSFSVSIDENSWANTSANLLIWTEELIYWIAARYVMLGFELELYGPGEYCMVYWYLYIIFVKLMEKAQLRISQNSDASRRKGKKRRENSKDMARDARLSPKMLLLQCYIYLSEGLAMMSAALANERQSVKKWSAFSTEQEACARFFQHFDLLLKARVPDGVSYPLFKDSTAHVNFSAIVKYNYFRDIQRISKELKGSFSGDPERLSELRQIEQVAEHNRIALNVIHQVGACDPSLEISFVFSHHTCFAVAMVKRA